MFPDRYQYWVQVCLTLLMSSIRFKVRAFEQLGKKIPEPAMI